jgi:hypothetical protein
VSLDLLKFKLISLNPLASYRTDHSETSLQPHLAPVDHRQVARTHYEELKKIFRYLPRQQVHMTLCLLSYRISRSSPTLLQKMKIPAQQYDRNPRGLHSSNSRNYRRMSTMNRSSDRSILIPTEVCLLIQSHYLSHLSLKSPFSQS